MTEWLDVEQQSQWRAVLTGTSALFDALNRDLVAATKLSLHEYEVLVRLSEALDRTLRMSVLAEGLVHSRSRLTHTIGRMEEAGLVLRKAALGDGRGVECALTSKGYDRLVHAAPVHVESVRARLVDIVSPTELAMMGMAFDRVAGQIADHPAP